MKFYFIIPSFFKAIYGVLHVNCTMRNIIKYFKNRIRNDPLLLREILLLKADSKRSEKWR